MDTVDFPMIRVGHMGLTGGIASAASAIWIRKRVLSSIEESSSQSSVRSRLRQRGKYALAGITFTGCATLVSGGLDSIEGALGFGHRTAGHSIPWVSTLYATARIAKDSGFDVARQLCEHVGVPEFVDNVVDALEDLTSWILSGGLAGAVIHWVGDIPTFGHGGTALQLLAPLVQTKSNLSLVLAADPLLNQGALYIGGILASVSWLVIGAYLSFPKQSVNRIETKVSGLIRWITDKIPDRERLYERAQNLYDRIISWIRKLSTSIGSPGPASLPLESLNESPVASSMDLRSTTDSDRLGSSPPKEKNRPPRSAGELSLRARIESN